MVSEIATKKTKMTLSKYFIIILLFCFGGTWSQNMESDKPSYKKFNETFRYTKDKKYRGPENNIIEPTSMENFEEEDEFEEEGFSGLEYDPKDIQRSRNSKNKFGKGGGGSTGDKKYDPNISEPDKIEFEPPELNPPNIPNVKGPTISPMIWKVILIVLGILLLAWIVYLIVKNYRPAIRPLEGNLSASDWNPVLIPKTELELRLEAAMEEENYRECVRIWFTFILKESIRLRKIKWKKELTNYDYLIQMSGKDGYTDFHESVRIYDIVWYGEYDIGKTEYLSLVPHLQKNYENLKNKHE